MFSKLTITTQENKKNPTDLISLDSQLKLQIEDLISYGLKCGADFVEVFLERKDNLGILAEQDTITNLSPAFTIGAGVRVFSGLNDGFVSTNDLSKNGLEEALIKALSMLGLSNKILHEINNFQGLMKLKDYTYNKNDWLARCPNYSESTSKILEASNNVKKYGAYIQSRRSSYSRCWQEVLIASSDGTFARDIRLHQSIGLNLIANDKQYISSIGKRLGSYGKPSDLIDWDSSKTAEEACDSAGKMLYAQYVKAGQKPVVLANKFGGVIFHEACGHLLETTQIERGTTPFASKKGQLIAHPSLTAIDEGLTDGAFGTISVDDEGMEPQKTVLIENGILKNFISDRAGELRTGIPRTGSGRRQGYSYAAASRMRNTFIDKGKFKPNQLISSIEDGLYCKSMGGGSVGPTGQFNFTVEEGYLIENGELTKPVKGATLIGEAKEILPRISMCADDLELAAGFCGSVSGSVNVTVGQPHIKVDSITVGGR